LISGDLTINGDMTVSGAFTSVGIDDNAVSIVLTLGADNNATINGNLDLGANGNSGKIVHRTNGEAIEIGGGASTTAGGNLYLYAADNSLFPGDVVLASDGHFVAHWDESAGSWSFLTGTPGAKTQALLLDASQNATFAGTVDVSGANIRCGVEDTLAGNLTLYGGPAGGNEGGQVNLKTSADFDTTIDFWSLDAYQATFRIGAAGVGTALTLDSNRDATFAGSVTGTSFSGAGTGLTGTAANLTAGNITVNAITGQPDIGADIVDADEIIINDGGIIKRSNMNRVANYVFASPNATFTGTVIAPAATTSIPSIRLPHGTAPSSPTNGDLWTTTSGVFARINGVSQNLLDGAGDVSASGTPVNNELAVWTNASTIEGEPSLTFNSANDRLTVGAGASGAASPQIDIDAQATGVPTISFNQAGVQMAAISYVDADDMLAIQSDFEIEFRPGNVGDWGIFSTTSAKLGNYTFNTDQTVGAGQDNYVLVYDNGSGEIGLEAAGAGGGDVVKVGTPVNNQLGVWTGDGSIEGDANLTWDGTTLTLGNGQLNFPATQNASADANTLDDYQEGTFTPSVTDTGFNTSEATYTSIREGTYTKIGNRVFFEFAVQLSALNTLSGDIFLTGLPENVNAASPPGVCTIRASSLSITAGENLVGQLTNNTDRIGVRIWNSTVGTTTLQASEMTDNVRFDVSGHYRV
jgi:hypothetical protein